MNTALKTEEEKKEYFDSPEVLDKKVSELAEMIGYSKHMSVFTGAGISTAAGIPDYRSGANTVIKTGAGYWESAANIDKARKAGKKVHQIPRSKFDQTIVEAMPTTTHMALVELAERDILKHIISQNIDGLHRKSGIPASKITELHGNMNTEKCEKCNKVYMRDFKIAITNKKKDGKFDHSTKRTCDDPKCGGDLFDSMVNFGESLPDDALRTGFENGQKADLMICMGSSLRVQPAASMPAMTAM